MKAHRLAAALEHDDLGVVEQPLARDAAEAAGGAHQRAGQRVHREVEDELAPQRPRVRQHDDEEPERALAAGHGDLADVGPVDLGLLAGQRLGAQVDLAARLGADVAHVLAQRADRAGVAALGDHVVQPRRAQPRVAGQRLGDEVTVRVDEPQPRRCGLRARLAEPEDAPDHVRVDAELGGDGADASSARRGAGAAISASVSGVVTGPPRRLQLAQVSERARARVAAASGSTTSTS